MSNTFENNSSTQNSRFIFFFTLLLCATVAYFNFNVGVGLALIAGLFLIKKFGLLEYVGCAVILLVKSQNEVVLSSQDLASHVETFKLISTGVMTMDSFQWGEYAPGEIILPFIFWLFGIFFESGSLKIFSFTFVLSFLTVFYFVLRLFERRPLVLLFVVLLLDVNLVVHLYRQSISSLLLLIGLSSFLLFNQLRMNCTILIIISFLTHLTNVIFAPLVLIFKKTPLYLLKILVLIAGFIAFNQDGKVLFRDAIAMSHGLPILGKISFALTVFEAEGGIRELALIAAIFGLFINQDSILIRVFLGFTALMLIVYGVPILSTRVGLIGTSILTGLPIGIAAFNARSYLANIVKLNYINTKHKPINSF